MDLVEIIDQLLPPLTILGQIIIVALLILALVYRRGVSDNKFFQFFSNNAIAISFVVALVAMSGSLFYSEIAGYDPCKLCWFQRIFMYPQVFLLGLALWRREKEGIIDYSIMLSAIGALIAGYHYLLQINITSTAPCSVVGYSANCSQRFIMDFGYITIPMIALTAFLLILVLMISRKILAYRS